MILASVEKALAEHGVLRSGAMRVLVACSGGIDSIVLTHAVATLLGARRVVVGHVDHGVREESAADADFVRRFADSVGAEFLSERLTPRSSAEAHLRDLRYRTLEDFRHRVRSDLILTAHTQDDQAETVLMGLIRSTTPRALLGIPRARSFVVRPLLDVSRAEVEAYAVRAVLEWRQDSTNLDPTYLRNRIRKELLPLLERRYRPGLRRRLAGLPDRLGDEGVLRSAGAAGRDSRPRIALNTRMRPRSGEDPLGHPRATAGPSAPGPSAVAPSVHSPCERSLNSDHGAVSVDRIAGHAISISCEAWGPGPIPDGKMEAVFDADVVPSPVVRLARLGDRIRPFNMMGRRKLNDVLREAGVPPAGRAQRLVLALPEGEVLWVPGVMRSGHAPVGEATRHVWRAKLGETELQARARQVTLSERDMGEKAPVDHPGRSRSDATERASEGQKER